MAEDPALQRDHAPGNTSGYAHPSYARSLAEFGRLVQLGSSGGWLLARDIPGTDRADAIGPYPFFTCMDYGRLAEDLDRLASELISVAVVPDPFDRPDSDRLSSIFDRVVPFKTHYLVDLKVPFADYLHRHHRRYAKRGLASFAVEVAARPAEHAAEWADLYAHLVARHGITGIRAFSRASLGMQLAVPGCHYFRALRAGVAEGALVCYLDRGVAYAHLVSTTAAGQALMAQYALYWTAIEHFRGAARWFALGSTPGPEQSPDSGGLGFFKSGWATSTCQSWFCGRVLDREGYSRLAGTDQVAATGYFPAYRKPGFE